MSAPPVCIARCDTAAPHPPAAADSEEEGPPSDEQQSFFRYYGMIVHQQNMLADTVRTGTYQQAVMRNKADFAGKTILDVGTGSGILALFAAQAGARKVYGVEASRIADCAELLIKGNGFQNVIEVVKGKVEEVELPEKVDIIISEPMGFLLVHERMLESFVRARQRFLKPGGKMYPSRGTMYFLPFSDWGIFNEQTAKTQFWQQEDFFGLELSALEAESRRQHFSQPVVGYFDPSVLIAPDTQAATHIVDFETIAPEDLEQINVPFRFTVSTTSILHGIACWFDVDFLGTEAHVKLSTGPRDPGTHWYQCRLLLLDSVAVNATQVVSGTVAMRANKKFSYDITLTVKLEGTDITSVNHICLDNQMYHYLQSPAAAEPAAQ